MSELCPTCWEPEVARDTGDNGNSTCSNGHFWRTGSGAIPTKDEKELLAVLSKKDKQNSDLKVLAAVEFNDREALVLNRPLSLKYNRIHEDVIVGNDGPFWACYYRKGCPGGRAFAGREFTLTMEDGEVVECKGDWWWSMTNIARAHILGEEFEKNYIEGGYGESDKLPPSHVPTIIEATASSLLQLGECYCFTGHFAHSEQYRELRSTYSGPVYGYHEYENIFIRPVKERIVHELCEQRNAAQKELRELKHKMIPKSKVDIVPVAHSVEYLNGPKGMFVRFYTEDKKEAFDIPCSMLKGPYGLLEAKSVDDSEDKPLAETYRHLGYSVQFFSHDKKTAIEVGFPMLHDIVNKKRKH